LWLCGKLREFASKWKSRTDVPPKKRDSVQLDPQIEKLETFGKHAYTQELTTQRTIINDFLGGRFLFSESFPRLIRPGAQNFFQEGAPKEELEEAVDNVITHILKTSPLWKGILPLSAWASAIGALVNAVAKKIIADVFDRDDLGADETTNITELITKVSSLNDLFVFEPAAPNGRKNSLTLKSRKPSLDGAMPVGPTLTHRFADKWMKMCMLGEVLDANLMKIEDLWFRDELSLDFNRDEVVDLIKMCFEDNTQARALCRKIQLGPIRGPDEVE
jgi:centromere/kinetochore protein ZW10